MLLIPAVFCSFDGLLRNVTLPVISAKAILPLAIPRTTATYLVSGGLVLFAVAELAEPVLDDTDQLLGSLAYWFE